MTKTWRKSICALKTSPLRSTTAKSRAANVLQVNRASAAMELARSIATWPKFTPEVSSMGLEAFSQRETIALVDYLIEYLETNDRTWRDLYIGERLKQMYLPATTSQDEIERRAEVMASDRRGLIELMDAQLDTRGRGQLTAALQAITTIVTSPAVKEVRALMVGDCLFLDVLAFLTAALHEDCIALRPSFATSKNPAELRQSLRNFGAEKFDLVFYSPYTYEFDLLLSQSHYLRVLKMRGLSRMTAKAHRETALTLGLLSDMFDCPIFVHNSANVRRHDGSFGSRLRNLLTHRSRQVVARSANTLLESAIDEINRYTAHAVALIDERPLLSLHGDQRLGEKFYDSGIQHPAVFGKMIAPVYRDVINSAAHLFRRKVIVTDLDHTLWAGMIGEGAVKHDRRRQTILKTLRQKGILLAIASKNESGNVRWDGGVLQAHDFVADQINWNPKSDNLRKIAAELNLKLKDFVFIDDSPEERAMVQLAMPEVATLDATAERTWRMLEWWAAAMPAQVEGDRTQLYRERREREQFLDAALEQENHANLLSSLDLRLKIHDASTEELARAAELINRTNQFNVRGSRTTVQELGRWRNSEAHRIIVVEAADKFGAMGIVSVMILALNRDSLEIHVWVLSCRVFGYGIETAMLNYVKRFAAVRGCAPVIGRVVETSYNEPCRRVYRDNGFSRVEEAWQFAGSCEIPDPAWLSIAVDDSGCALGATLSAQQPAAL